jgi:hypothetical protein
VTANERFLNTVRYACLRPRLYTATGETLELLGYINGLETGIFGSESPLGRQFNQWLAQVCNVPAANTWYDTMHRCVGGIEQAPRRMSELFERYFLEVHQTRISPPVIPASFTCGYCGGGHDTKEHPSG